MADENTAGRQIDVAYGADDRPVYRGPHTVDHINRVLESPYGPDILAFGVDMAEKLDRNKHKGRWEDVSVNDMFVRLLDEMTELWKAVRTKEPARDQMYECADVANFALIIWHVINRHIK